MTDETKVAFIAFWEPIATAPKDGRRLLISVGHHVDIAYWREDAQFGDGESKPGWQIFACEMDEWYAVATDAADHWMPLPEPIRNPT